MHCEDLSGSDQAAPTLRSADVSAACSPASFRRAPDVQIVEATPVSGARRLASAARESAPAPRARAASGAPKPGMLGVIGKVVRAVGAEALVAVAAAARPGPR